jgi:enoyl-CoA hydratase/carnithine racemase
VGDQQPLVSTQLIEHVLVISIVRQHKRNAIDRVVANQLSAALDRVDDDAGILAAVLTGTARIFSAGSDLNARGDYSTERGGEYGLIRRRRVKPLIAAVEGPALGGGFEMVLACDLVVAARGASFRLPEVRIGGVPTSGGIFRAAKAIPRNVAREMMLTGDPLSAERAHQLGLVNVLSQVGSALADAVDLARRICRNAPLGVQSCLTAFADEAAEDDSRGWQLTQQAFQRVATTADLAEGVAAMLERRSPAWKGV